MFRRSKTKVEGWAVDVDEEILGLRERLGGSTKLWIACLVVVVSLVVILLSQSLSSREKPITDEPNGEPIGIYTDSDHTTFADEIITIARKRGVVVQAKFISDKSFKIVMPCDVMPDEVSYLSRSAATGIARRFKVSPVILTYTENNDSSVPKLAARTVWSRELGEFMVNFEGSLGTE